MKRMGLCNRLRRTPRNTNAGTQPLGPACLRGDWWNSTDPWQEPWERRAKARPTTAAAATTARSLARTAVVHRDAVLAKRKHRTVKFIF
jgi:hypothetical protein